MARTPKVKIHRPRLSFDALVATKGTQVAKARLEKKLSILDKKITATETRKASLLAARDTQIAAFNAAIANVQVVNAPVVAPTPVAPVTPETDVPAPTLDTETPTPVDAPPATA